MTINTLIFDLDDTLYPPSSGVWDAVGVRIDNFILENLAVPAEKVTMVRDDLFHRYGTTLRGLQVEFGVDPYKYLNYVHNIPLEDYLQPNPALRQILNQIDARKTIFTNSDQNHALRVLDRLRLGGIFDRIIDVMDVAPYCKPMPEAFKLALKILGDPDPSTCVVIEDSLRNVDTAREMGFRTILVGRHNGRADSADARLDSLEDLLDLRDLPMLKGVWKQA
ncbi:MAG: pyrimidine 5'-nucleotidase [Bellilinea sp.]